jgi:hypothetical protein
MGQQSPANLKEEKPMKWYENTLENRKLLNRFNHPLGKATYIYCAWQFDTEPGVEMNGVYITASTMKLQHELAKKRSDVYAFAAVPIPPLPTLKKKEAA